MAKLRKGTTIGGSIAVTEENISDYIDNLVIDLASSIDTLKPKSLTWQEHINLYRLTDLDNLDPERDIGIYQSVGDVMNPSINLYGQVVIPNVLKDSNWSSKDLKMKVDGYYASKSPLAEDSLVIVVNRSNDSKSKSLLIICYHYTTKQYYHLVQDVKTGKFNKTWVLDPSLQKVFENVEIINTFMNTKMDKSANLKDVANVTTARSNLGLGSSATLNKTDVKGVSKSLVATQFLVDTATTDVKNEAIADTNTKVTKLKNDVDVELKKKLNIGDYGLGGSIKMKSGPDPLDYTLKTGFESYADKGASGQNQPPTFHSGDTAIRISMNGLNNTLLYFNQGSNKMYWHMRAFGKDKGWTEVLSTDNTTEDNSGFLRLSGTKHAVTTDKVKQASGTSTTDVPSIKFVTDEFKKTNDTLNTVVNTTVTDLNKKIDTKITGGSVVQVLSTSTTNVPSVKLVSDEFTKINTTLNEVVDKTVVDLQKKIDTKITGGSVVQVLSASTTNVPSVKLVSDEFTKINTTLNEVVDKTVVDLQKKIDTKITGGVLVSTEGTSTTNVMTQKATTDALNKRITGGSVVQVSGTSTVNVPSQKFVTDELNKLDNKMFVNHGSVGTVDLNTLNKESDTGFWYNQMTANATLARNYPPNGLSAGHLLVYRSAGMTQVYVTYNEGNRVFKRNNYPLGSDKWSKWVEEMDETWISQVQGSETNKLPSLKLFTDEINRRPLTTTMNTELGKKLNNSDVLNALGTSTTKPASQKIVNDVSVRTTTAQSRADSAYTLASKRDPRNHSIVFSLPTMFKTNGSAVEIPTHNVSEYFYRILPFDPVLQNEITPYVRSLFSPVKSNEGGLLVAKYIGDGELYGTISGSFTVMYKQNWDAIKSGGVLRDIEVDFSILVDKAPQHSTWYGGGFPRKLARGVREIVDGEYLVYDPSFTAMTYGDLMIPPNKSRVDGILNSSNVVLSKVGYFEKGDSSEDLKTDLPNSRTTEWIDLKKYGTSVNMRLMLLAFTGVSDVSRVQFKKEDGSIFVDEGNYRNNSALRFYKIPYGVSEMRICFSLKGDVDLDSLRTGMFNEGVSTSNDPTKGGWYTKTFSFDEDVILYPNAEYSFGLSADSRLGGQGFGAMNMRILSGGFKMTLFGDSNSKEGVIL